MLYFGAISPKLERNGAVHDGGGDVVVGGRRQTAERRAPRGQICVEHDLQQSPLDHESLERGGTAARARRVPAAAAEGDPDCQ